MALKLSERIKDFQKDLESCDQESKEMSFNLKMKLEDLEEEQNDLMSDMEGLQKELKDVEAEEARLQEQIKVSKAVPERKMIFKGKIEKGTDGTANRFDVIPQIRYPVEGGTAVITFEDSDVAQNILDRKEHEVEVGHCQIKVTAHPIELPCPSYAEIQTSVCNKRILVSNIPKDLPTDQLLDKLEIFFSKSKNDGGEVDDREFLPDSGNVVIAFSNDGIAKTLTSKENFSVPLIEKTCLLKVTPYIMGEIKDLKVTNIVSEKSVLLRGIPDIMEEEILADNLEIYFQKPSNGGGEVDAFLYIPAGRCAIAVFEQDVKETE